MTYVLEKKSLLYRLSVFLKKITKLHYSISRSLGPPPLGKLSCVTHPSISRTTRGMDLKFGTNVVQLISSHFVEKNISKRKPYQNGSHFKMAAIKKIMMSKGLVFNWL